MNFGERIKELREGKDLLQRQLAATLEIDTPMFSKMERGDRFFRKKNILSLSEIFYLPEKELLTIWLANKVLHNIHDEEYQIEGLELALTNLSQNA